jgi:hypothetical protein
MEYSATNYSMGSCGCRGGADFGKSISLHERCLNIAILIPGGPVHTRFLRPDIQKLPLAITLIGANCRKHSARKEDEELLALAS